MRQRDCNVIGVPYEHWAIADAGWKQVVHEFQSSEPALPPGHTATIRPQRPASVGELTRNASSPQKFLQQLHSAE